MALPLPNIQHVILLMFENRSFDNVLGNFYPGTLTDGGVPTGWSNPWEGNPPVLAWKAAAGSAAQTYCIPIRRQAMSAMLIP